MENRFLCKAQAKIEKGLQVIAISFFAIIFLAATAQIIMRWIFNSPLVWSEELIRLMFIWICYLGWIFATKNGSHITITAFVSKLNPTAQRVLDIFNALLVVLFSFLMVWYGILMTKIGARGLAVTLPINFAVVYVICPIANLFILCYQIIRLVNLFKNDRILETSMGKGA